MLIDYSDRMHKLKAAYRLSFLHNPGGGAFSLDGVSTECQIAMNIGSDESDYNRLVEWLRMNNASRLQELLDIIDLSFDEIKARFQTTQN